MLITGAGSGIGKACALRFASAGMRVALLDICADSLDAVAARLAEHGAESIGIVTDVSDPEACEYAVRKVLASWESVDVLVANAGVQIGGNICETNPDDWQKILDVNLNGAAYSCRAVIPPMLSQGEGSIAIVSSVNAIVGSPGMTVYDMSKAGVLALMRSLAAEYGAQNIRVNAVSPGNTITDFHIDRMAEQGVSVEQIREMTSSYGLLGRAAEPEEIANAIYFVSSDEATFITGHNLVVDGGYSISGKA
ncbi:MAG: SDR family oxidoreductase [Gammaproteobacteria bacterium]|nr:SDR family oxidoreductase [Gammaproteobacteria bacterium]